MKGRTDTGNTNAIIILPRQKCPPAIPVEGGRSPCPSWFLDVDFNYAIHDGDVVRRHLRLFLHLTQPHSLSLLSSHGSSISFSSHLVILIIALGENAAL